jgi:hypothetical protein
MLQETIIPATAVLEEAAMKGARIGLLIGALGVVFALGTVGYELLLGPDRLDFSPEGLPRTLESGDWLLLLIVPGVLIITGLALLPFVHLIFPTHVKDGVSAPARVLKVWDTGVSVNDNPEVGLLLEVSPPMLAPYQVQTKKLVSRLQAALVQPGIAAEVKYDPHEPSRLEIVSLNLGAPPHGDAAARLQELKDLRDGDLVTEVEYEAKREEILRAL